MCAMDKGCCFLKIFSAGKDFQDSAASGKPRYATHQSFFISMKSLACLSAPSIAQLVERWTVVVLLTSIGRWFESGSKDT